jgi:mRNA-degrading endonuclease toxin of MazEF toxin-antitoxin module
MICNVYAQTRTRVWYEKYNEQLCEEQDETKRSHIIVQPRSYKPTRCIIQIMDFI